MKVALIAVGIIPCVSPLSSSAMLLGEMALHSHLGQPLYASILLKADAEEKLDSRCFSLGRPGNQRDYVSYLTQARLDLVETEGQPRLTIRSTQAINEPLLHVLVSGSCGQGHLTREFTLLLDPIELAQPRSTSLKQAEAVGLQVSKAQDRYVWDTRQGETLRFIATSLFPRQMRMQRDFLRGIRDANPELRDTPADAPLPEGGVIQIPDLRSLNFHPTPVVESFSKPHHIRKSAEQAAADPVEQPKPILRVAKEDGFLLKLSTLDLDLSLLGKMTEAQRQQLREKQLLLDADNQVANTLSMKNRIMQLEEQIDGMQKALEQTNSRMLLSEKLAAPPVQDVLLTQSDTNSNGSSWLDNTSFRGMAGSGLILAFLLSAWWRWRRRQAQIKLDFEPDQDLSLSETHPPEQSRVSEAKLETADQEDSFLSSVTSIFDNEGESVTFTEAESVLDEADLYMDYGWANRAIELLQDYLEKHPEDVQLWKKLFEIYGSQGMKQEFEQFALRCQSAMNDPGLWVLVQKLGRKLDAENPLYHSGHEEHEEVGAAVVEQNEVPMLDTPLEFVLDHERPPQPEGGKEPKHLELDPLFPELFENTRQMPENGKSDKASS